MKHKIKILLLLPFAGLFLGLAIYGGKRAAVRLWHKIPSVREGNLEARFDERRLLFASELWQDRRPLHLFFGDSHIELGDWYSAFQGAFAVRNCGVSTARIEQVASFVSSVRDPEIEVAILHCGINNLSRNESPSQCLEAYKELIDKVLTLNPRRIVVVGVMPVIETPVDGRNRDMNSRVREFNLLLKELSESRGIEFVDLTPAVADGAGGLRSDFTRDGLHLNPSGYQAITPLVRTVLSP